MSRVVVKSGESDTCTCTCACDMCMHNMMCTCDTCALSVAHAHVHVHVSCQWTDTDRRVTEDSHSQVTVRCTPRTAALALTAVRSLRVSLTQVSL